MFFQFSPELQRLDYLFFKQSLAFRGSVRISAAGEFGQTSSVMKLCETPGLATASRFALSQQEMQPSDPPRSSPTQILSATSMARLNVYSCQASGRTIVNMSDMRSGASHVEQTQLNCEYMTSRTYDYIQTNML